MLAPGSRSRDWPSLAPECNPNTGRRADPARNRAWDMITSMMSAWMSGRLGHDGFAFMLDFDPSSVTEWMHEVETIRFFVFRNRQF
jgi:hypothetical protein